MKGIAIIAAAGKGTRAGVDKIWMNVGGRRLIEKTVEPFFAALTVDEIALVVAPDKVEDAKALFASSPKPCVIVAGGETRTQSIRNALSRYQNVKEDAVVAVHDGARPFVSRALVEHLMLLAAERGSAVPVLPCSDSLRTADENGSHAIARETVFRVQTPQCFDLKKLLTAYSYGDEATDDATLFEKHVGEITLADGEEENRKITYLSDVYNEVSARVGVGLDVHPLVFGRPLILGGVNIPFEKGLDGHSDADALVHAIMDALLTAAHLPDIGHWFPPSDDKYKDANSILLMKEVLRLVKREGYVPVNVSATVMAEAPKLAPYLSQMEKTVADALGLPVCAVKFAATTTEKLGIVGEGKGIAAEAVALLSKESD